MFKRSSILLLGLWTFSACPGNGSGGDQTPLDGVGGVHGSDAAGGGLAGSGTPPEPSAVTEPAGPLPPPVKLCGVHGSGPLSQVARVGSRIVVVGARNLVLRATDFMIERELGLAESAFEALAVSPGGKLIAVAPKGSPKILLVDLDTGAIVKTLASHSDAVLALTFSPDGLDLVSGSVDKTAKVWDVAQGTVRHTFTEPTAGVSVVAVSHKTIAIDGGSSIGDHEVFLYQRQTGALLGGIDGEGRSTDALALYEGGIAGEYLARAADSNLTVWTVATQQKIENEIYFKGIKRFLSVSSSRFIVEAGSFVSNSAIVTLVFDRTGGITSLEEASVQQLPYQATSFHGAPGSFVTLAKDNAVRVYDRAAEAKIVPLPDLQAWSVDAIAPGKLALGGKDGKVRILDADTGALIKESGAHSEEVVGVAGSPKGDVFATSSLDGTVRVFNTADYSEKGFANLQGQVAFSAFSPDGQRIAVGTIGQTPESPGTVSVLGLSGLTTEKTLSLAKAGEGLYPRAAWGVAFSPDGTLLAAAGSHPTNALQVWKVPGFETVFRAPKTEGMFAAPVIFTPDSRLVIAGASALDETSGTLLVRTAEGRPVAVKGRRTTGIKALGLVGESRFIGTGHVDGTIGVWQSGSFDLVHTFPGHTGPVFALRSLDANRFITAGQDGMVRVWCLSP